RQHQSARPVLRLVPAQFLLREQPGQTRQAHGVRRKAGPGQSRFAGLYLWLARRPHRAGHGRLCVHPGAARQEAFCDGRVRPHRGRDQPTRQGQAQPLDPRRRQVPRHAGPMAGRRYRAPRQLVDRLVGLAQEPCGQTDCSAQGLWQRRQIQGHRARARPLCQAESL
ncbi:hypothetical protein KXW64_008389, partial [Aspergillus fumigatus]